MLRLELTFLCLASGGGYNARGCAKGKSANCSAASHMGITTRARGLMRWAQSLGSILPDVYLLPTTPTDPENPIASATPE